FSALKNSSPCVLYCSAVMPRLTGDGVRAGPDRRGGVRLIGVLPRVEVAPPMAVPDVVPPPTSCWAIVTPAVRKSAPANASPANHRLVIEVTPYVKVSDLRQVELKTKHGQL